MCSVAIGLETHRVEVSSGNLDTHDMLRFPVGVCCRMAERPLTDGHALPVDGAQVGILKELHKVRFRGLRERAQYRGRTTVLSSIQTKKDYDSVAV